MLTEELQTRNVWWLERHGTRVFTGTQIGEPGQDGNILVRTATGRYGFIEKGFVHPKNTCDHPRCVITFLDSAELTRHLIEEHS